MTASNAPLRILVVDDSNTIRRSAEIFLKQGGHEVLLADDGFVTGFARDTGISPDLPMRARAALPGGADPHWT